MHLSFPLFLTPPHLLLTSSSSAVKNKILYRREQLVIIQKNVRMYNACKKYRPRYMGVLKIKGLQVSRGTGDGRWVTGGG